MKRIAIVYLVLGLTIPSIAAATQVTRAITFSATDFEFASGSGPAPVDPASGNLLVTFDDATDAENVTSGITFGGFNFAVDTVGALPAYSFHTDFFGAGPVLEIGTVCACGIGSVDQIGPGTDAFLLGIFDPAGAAASGFFGFSQAGFDDVAFADTLDIGAAGVPEPDTWLLMVAGLGATGAIVRRAGRSPALSGRHPHR